MSNLVALHSLDPNDYLEGVPVVTFKDWTDALFARQRKIMVSRSQSGYTKIMQPGNGKYDQFQFLNWNPNWCP